MDFVKKTIGLLILLLFIAGLTAGEESNFKMTLQTGNPGGVAKIAFTNDGSMFATANLMNKTIKIWNSRAKLIHLINNGEDINTCELAFSPDNKYLAYTNYMYFKIYNLETGELITVKGSSDIMNRLFNGIAFANDGKSVFTGTFVSMSTVLPLEIDEKEFNDDLARLDAAKAEILKNAYNYDGNSQKYKLNLELNDHSNLYEIFVKLKTDISKSIQVSSNRIEQWGLNGNYIRMVGEHNNESGKMISKILASPDGKILLSAGMDGLIKIWDINNGLVNTIQGSNSSDIYVNMKFNSSGTLFGWTTYSGIKVCNLNGVYLININRTMSGASDIDIDKKMIVEYAYDIDSRKNTIPMLRIRNFRDEVQKDIKGITSTGYSLRLNPQATMLASGTLDGIVNMINLSNASTVSLINENKEWLAYTPDGYWDSSKNGGKLVAMVQDMEAYSVDQFAVKYNRPDIILKRLGTESDDVINYYYYQYKKRLRKMNFNEEDLSNELHVPEVKLLNSKIRDKFIKLSFNLSDTAYNLKSYNIYVNDVPIFGSYGKPVSGNNKTVKENVELSSGKNKIEITCLNEKGAESFRAMTMADYGTKVKGDLYYIGFGISKYKDDSLNLKYADKDARDLGDIFGKMNGYFDNIYVKIFTNEDVTVDNIKKAKDLLKNAKVDDTFVLFIAGHGVHDSDPEATYYYLTYNADLDNMSKTCVDFDLIEDILQGIPPRNKLFLMDTCESGEVGDDSRTEYLAMADSRGLKARAIKRGLKIKTAASPEMSRALLFDNDWYINNNLVRRSGAIVFSACKGGEFSYESDQIKNGIFTRAIINTLESATPADSKEIPVDELRKLVIKSVSGMTSGKQNPTVDRDNIFIKFGFPVVK